VELHIVIEALDPPSGRAVVDGNDAWAFTGWLDLIEHVERLREQGERDQHEAGSDSAV
jgi:hypothetical protein